MIIDELDAGLRRDPGGPAVIAATRRGTPVAGVTRGDLADLADGYAAALHRRGLQAGQTLGVAVRPGGRSLAILLAARKLGLRVAAIDPTAGAGVLLARLTLAAPELVLADAAAQAVAGSGGPSPWPAGLTLSCRAWRRSGRSRPWAGGCRAARPRWSRAARPAGSPITAGTATRS
jgi:olefin beta-lactone synthetase